ncbi:MAG: stationary phase survival protein SurE, partial [Pseudomonadota bacterium]
AHGADVIRGILKAGFEEEADYSLFYNVNFPPVMADDVKGIRAVRQGVREGVHFGAVSDTSPSGSPFLWIKGGNQHVAVPEDTDAGANLDGYVSVTPMRADLTAHDALTRVAKAFD